MPAESQIGHFSEMKNLCYYKQKYNPQCYIYIPQWQHYVMSSEFLNFELKF